VRIGTKVVARHRHVPDLGTGIIVDIKPTGLLRVVFDDDYCDNFAPPELKDAPAETEEAQAA
jgi:hypothetical protein